MCDSLEFSVALDAASAQVVETGAQKKANKAKAVVEAQLSHWYSNGDAIAAQQNGLIDKLEAVNRVVSLLSLIYAELEGGVGFLQSTPKLFTELQQSMVTLPSSSSEIGRGHVCTLLREEEWLLRRKVKERASLLLMQNIHVDSLCLRVLKYVCNVDKDDSSGSLTLLDVFQSIRDLSESEKDGDLFLVSCTKDIVEALQVTICGPIVRGGKLYSSKTSGGEHETSWVLTETSGQNRLQSFQLKLSTLVKLVEFCRKELFVLSQGAGNPRYNAIYMLLYEGKRPLVPLLQEELVDVVEAEIESSHGDSGVLAPGGLLIACEAFDRKIRALLPVSLGDKDIEDSPLSGHWSSLPAAIASALRLKVLNLAQRALRSSQASCASTMTCTGDGLDKDRDDLMTTDSEVDEDLALFITAAPSLGEEGPVGAAFEQCVVGLACLALAQLLRAFLSLSCCTIKSQAALDGISEASLDSATDVHRQTVEDVLDLYMAYARSRESETRGAKERGVLFNSYNYLAYSCTHFLTQFRSQQRMLPGVRKAIGSLHSAAQALLNEHFAEQQRVLAKMAGRIKLSVDGETVVSGKVMTTSLDQSLASSSTPQPGDKDDASAQCAPATAPTPLGFTTPGGGIYDLAQKLGALGDATPALPAQQQQQEREQPKQNLSPYSQAFREDSTSLTGMGIRRGLAELWHQFDLARDEEVSGALNDVGAAQAAMRHVVAVAAQWRRALPRSVQVWAAGSLVELLCHWCCEQIINAPMMAEAAIDGVVQVLEEVSSYENELAATVFPAGRSQRRGSARRRIAVYVPSWPKLSALRRFLACVSLSEVTDGISARHFACLSSIELAGLVKSVFEDSSKRAMVIQNIYSLVH